MFNSRKYSNFKNSQNKKFKINHPKKPQKTWFVETVENLTRRNRRKPDSQKPEKEENRPAEKQEK
jgi:hypothetical protein